MAVNPKGIVVWSNPSVSGSPHRVSLTVVDSEGSTSNVSWTITVTTNGFRFIDAVNGRSVAQGGTGTIGNPWRSMRDWYGGDDYASKASNTYENQFLYWRAGVYFIDAYVEDKSATSPGRMPVSAQKPVVWLAYPGETPIIDHGYNGAADSGPFIIFYGGTGGSSNVYIDGLEFTNMKYKGIEVDPGGNNQVLRRLNMNGLRLGADGSNAAFIMTTTGQNSDNMIIQDSTFYDLNLGTGAAGLKIYAKNKILIEDNTLHTFTGGTNSEGIALKGHTVRATVRGNTIYDIPNKAIGGNMHPLQDAEIIFNRIYNVPGVALDINQDGLAGPTYIYRNTILGRVQVRNTDSSDGPFVFERNVIVNGDSGTPAGSHIFYSGVTDNTRIVQRDNLSGYYSANIVDSSGNLTEAFSQHVGVYGYQMSTYIRPPSGVQIVR
jgi:hypothetical protein